MFLLGFEEIALLAIKVIEVERWLFLVKGASKGGLCPTEEPVLLYLYTTLKHTVLTLRKSHKVTKLWT